MKRVLDLLVGGTIFVATFPVQLLVAGVIALRLGRPVLFRQRRIGFNGKPFVLVKFRSMAHPDPAAGRVTDEDRLTVLGRWLRRTSLDELPTLWNVVRGDMSLIGPRPLLPQYLERYTAEQARRHEVRPGVTGWAQVNGRNALSWETRLAYDVWYVDHASLRLDARILLLTLKCVIGGSGVSADGHATMPEFQGRS